MKKRRQSSLVSILVGGCFLCALALCCFAILLNLVNPIPPTNTPALMNVSTIIALTSDAALASTHAAYTPTSPATFTPLSTSTPLPTFTETANLLATLAAAPTNTPAVIIPVIPSSSGQTCECGGDFYNCPGFNSQSEAQSCFQYCRSLGYDDPHDLDRDNDLLACEETDY